MSKAIAKSESGLQIEGYGTVIRLLDDDLHGSRHQRFIVQLRSGDTILVVHNIDLAPRIDTLQPGDEVGFYGEYKWNLYGGLVHWTHNDSDVPHVNGWVKHNGKMYQ